MANRKLETALHIACRGRDEDTELKDLLKADTDVNARNVWGQTPLHYAADSKSISKIKLLLQVPNIDVNLTDINGYNALHSLINCGETFDSDFEEGIDALINASVCINATTYSGQTVLHLAAMQNTNEDNNYVLLKHLLYKYPCVDKLVRNKLGANFLHLCVKNQPSVCVALLRELSKQDNNLPSELLNDKNACGQTPFYCLVIRDRLAWNVIKWITCIEKYGACVNTTDNLGNTMLHHLAKSILSWQETANMSVLVKNGANINIQNIWGKTAAFEITLRNDDRYDEMIKIYRTVDFRITDRWGRTPIFGILNKDSFAFGRILNRLLVDCDIDINCQDKFGTTPLHLAGYISGESFDLQVMKKLILDKALLATLEIKDNENDRPIDTALRQGNFKTYEMIATKMQNVETVDDSTNENFTYRCFKEVYLSTFNVNNDMSVAIKGFPRDIEMFSNYLLQMKHINFDPESNGEELDVFRSVGTLVQRICDKVKTYDSRFQMHIFRTGSTAEGTKVGRPDEFDFALCLDLVEQTCNIETVTDKDSVVYAMLKFNDDPIAREFFPFYDEDRYLQVLPLLIYLYRYIRRALFEADIWADGNIVFNDDLTVLSEKPVFNFTLFWVGSKYKHLNISVDMVPVVHKRGWWPSGIDLSLKEIVNEQVRDAGCFVLLQNKINNSAFMFRWVQGMQDCVFDTCNVSLGVEESGTINHKRCLTVSIAPAEIVLMKSLPELYRKAYALAKIFKVETVSSDIIKDIYPDGYKSIPTHYDSHNKVKSYWLKNCVFYVAESMPSAYGDLNHTKISTVETTRKVYEKLLELVTACRINPYLAQTTDVLMLEKKNEWETESLKEFLLHRKVLIDAVLKLLGKSTKCDDNSEWLEFCIKHYVHRTYSEEEKSQQQGIQLYKRQ